MLVAELKILDQVGLEMLSRWGHYLAGVTWVGLLYYFNFVQVPAFAGFEAGPRTEAISKLVPRALWWFRWGAVLTLLTGLSILAFQDALTDGEYWKTPPGISISTGILLALVMFANVWLVIWPKQKIVIASAQRVAAGGEADPNAAAAGRRGVLASRTNAFLSIPMLFFMGATSHWAARLFDEVPPGGDRLTYWIIVLVIVLLAELNGLGKLGGTEPGGPRAYLDDHKSTIIAGIVLLVVFIALWEILIG